MESKPFWKSTTFWGVVIAFAGLAAESVPQLAQLLGDEVAGKVGVVAGLLVALFGRIRASTTLTLTPALVLGALVLNVGGCATDAGLQARRAVLAPVAVRTWDDQVHALAIRGVADMVDDGELTDQTAAFVYDAVGRFDQEVHALSGD